MINSTNATLLSSSFSPIVYLEIFQKKHQKSNIKKSVISIFLAQQIINRTGSTLNFFYFNIILIWCD